LKVKQVILKQIFWRIPANPLEAKTFTKNYQEECQIGNSYSWSSLKLDGVRLQQME
jgi:hypothetical protein